MPETLHVRRVRPDDVPRVLELHEEAMRDVGAFIEDAPDTDLRDVEDEYLDPGGEFLVGEVDDRIVAMGAFRPATGYITEFLDGLTDATAEIKRMRVDPAHQRQGHGQRILDELERRARDRGFTEFVLDTGPDQIAAQRLYETNGFEEVRREPLDLPDRQIVLVFYRKRLAGPA